MAAPSFAEAAKKPSDGQLEERKALLLEALSYISGFRDQVVVVKYSGAAQVQAQLRRGFAADLALLQSLGMRPVLVHGGGQEINHWLKLLKLESRFKEGLRVTGVKEMEAAEMVLSGKLNKELVAELTGCGVLAVGISGKDGGPMLLASQQPGADGSALGLAGRVDTVNPHLLQLLLEHGYLPVVSPVGLGLDGKTYNINADHAASHIAVALQAEKLIFLTNVNGVLSDGRTISHLTSKQASELIQKKVIADGMKPKVESAIYALEQGGAFYSDYQWQRTACHYCGIVHG